ncbi:uncharacterized protein LOC125508100 [Triticum urartu]|uniref:uncharacterized protein LOC125508100 n=1 Tax=Triticum urartu TaxID=4572 RepID=UPI00204330E8|nr:uncharacterized protein LOC125508100 [Triticum urartu]
MYQNLISSSWIIHRMESKTDVLAQSSACPQINLNCLSAFATISCPLMMPSVCKWDRSSTPHPMGLSLKKIQSILNMKQSMDNDFSTLLCVFWHVTRKYCLQTIQYTTWIYNFVPCCGIQHEIKSFCDKETIQKLATLFDSWHGIDNNIYYRATWDLSGFYVFHFMLWWNGKDLVQPVCADGYELRKRFLLYLLKHHANEAKDNLPDIVREFLKRIK